MTKEIEDPSEKTPLDFEGLIDLSAEKFRTTPYLIIEVEGKRYTTAVDTRAAVALTLKDLNLWEDESALKRLFPSDVVHSEHQPIAIQLCDIATKKLLEKFPEFSKTSFIRWGSYSNRGPISQK